MVVENFNLRISVDFSIKKFLLNKANISIHLLQFGFESFDKCDSSHHEQNDFLCLLDAEGFYNRIIETQAAPYIILEFSSQITMLLHNTHKPLL